jgi:carbonic anhydrase
VIEYAIRILKVRHVIICGHTDCGGIRAAYQNNASGLAENWLQPVRKVIESNQARIRRIRDPEARLDRISELNVIEQLDNLLRTSIAESAFKSGIGFQVHGWVTNVRTGRIKELALPIAAWKKIGLLPAGYRQRYVLKQGS